MIPPLDKQTALCYYQRMEDITMTTREEPTMTTQSTHEARDIMPIVDGAAHCGHDPALHTDARGCTARVGARECLCHHTHEQARTAAGGDGR